MKTLIAILLFAVPAFANLKLALNWKAEPQFGGFYAADFKAAGLDVEVLEGGSGTPTIQMLSAGKVEYAIVSADELVISHDRGAKNAVALFATYQKNPQCIMVRFENPAKDVKSLMQDSSQTLLWQAGLPYALFLAKKYEVKIKTAPYQGGLGLFQKDPKLAQQCFATSEPLLAAKSGTPVRTFLVADEGFNPYTTVLVTTQQRLKENPEEVKKVVEAVRKGWTSYLNNPNSTNEAMAKINKAMDKDTFRKSAAAQRNLIKTGKMPELGSMTDERWKTLVEQMHSLQLIKTKPETSELFKNF